jgi:integrase
MTFRSTAKGSATFIRLLNDLKVPVKIAQEQLGHASISTTLNIYTHVVDASHRKAVEAVEERLFVEVDPNGPTIGDRAASGCGGKCA